MYGAGRSFGNVIVKNILFGEGEVAPVNVRAPNGAFNFLILVFEGIYSMKDSVKRNFFIRAYRLLHYIKDVSMITEEKY